MVPSERKNELHRRERERENEQSEVPAISWSVVANLR